MPRKIDPEGEKRIREIIRQARLRSKPEDVERIAAELEAEGLLDNSMDNYPPVVVIQAIGSAMQPEAMIRWWNTTQELLGGKSPKQLWLDGEQGRVINFIRAAQSGDMV